MTRHFFPKVSESVKVTAVYLFGNIITKGVGLVTTPFFTKLLTVEEIGEYTVFTTWYSLIGIVAMLSLSNGSFEIAMSDYEHSRNEYSSAMLGLSGLAAIMTGAVYFFRPVFFQKLLGLSDPEIKIMLLSFLLIPAYNYVLVRVRYEYRYSFLAKLSIFHSFFCAGFSIFIVYIAKRHCYGNLGEMRIIGLYSSQCLIGFFCACYLLQQSRKIVSPSIWKYALIVNIPLIVKSVAEIALQSSDKIIIAKFVGKRESGIYGMVYMFSGLAQMLLVPVTSVMTPKIFKTIKFDASDNIKEIITTIFVLYGFGCVMLVLAGPELIRILSTAEYLEAVYIMPPVASGIFISGVIGIYGIVPLYYKRTKFIMIASILSGTANLILNFLFIPKFGYMAAAYTTLFCYLLLYSMYSLMVHILKKSSYFNEKATLLIMSIVVILSIGSIALFKYHYIRYAFIFCLCCFLFAKRNMVLNLIVERKECSESDA